jgi:hypothetical protein
VPSPRRPGFGGEAVSATASRRIVPVAPRTGVAPMGPPEVVAAADCPDLRCGCGNLLARRVEGGVELKCRRCKRTVVLPLEEGRGD